MNRLKPETYFLTEVSVNARNVPTHAHRRHEVLHEGVVRPAFLPKNRTVPLQNSAPEWHGFIQSHPLQSSPMDYL